MNNNTRIAREQISQAMSFKTMPKAVRDCLESADHFLMLDQRAEKRKLFKAGTWGQLTSKDLDIFCEEKNREIQESLIKKATEKTS